MLKAIRSFSLLLVALTASMGLASAQSALNQTTLSAAITSSQTRILVASATGITANVTVLYVDNEAMYVDSVAGTLIGVVRGAAGTQGVAHIAGAGVLAGAPQAFISYDPSGACSNGSGLFLYSPIVNVNNGNQWLCSTVTGKIVPGFGNTGDTPQVTAAVASAAGQVTPSGPLFHITGGLAITGFVLPVGFDPKAGPGFCVIPDGTFTTTNANNIAIASTAVVSKTLCFTYDGNSAKFYPSY